MQMITRLATIILLCSLLSGCVGAVVGAVVDTTIEVAKVPFKVAGAVVDVAAGDDEPKRKKRKEADEE